MPSSGSSRRRAIVEIALYGVAGGLLIALLRWAEYRYLVVEHSFEVYAGLIAALFAALGLWLGRSLAAPKGRRAEPAPGPAPLAAITTQTAPPATAADEAFKPDANRLEQLGITARELEVLGLIALGLSNREIADRLFVSENTVKTHASRLFDKLGARRRTEAVQLGQRNRLIPAAAAAAGHPTEG